jgi:hypothetical protein
MTTAAVGAALDRTQFNKVILLGFLSLAALVAGLLLAYSQIMLAMLVASLIWLVLLPYHSTLAVGLAAATFGSALIVPFVPGRPAWWEMGALLAWSGLFVTVSLRRYDRESWRTIMRHKWIFLGLLGYSVVLLFIMRERGVGFMLFGSGLIGGRLYLQQLLIMVLPLIFVLYPLDPKVFTRLFIVQCLATGSFVVADFVLAYGGQKLLPLLYFFELPSDGISFEMMSMAFGIRRYQSLFFFAIGLISLLWILRNLNDYTNRQGLWLWPITLAAMGMGLFGGHRYLLVQVVSIGLICAYTQRFFTIARTIASVFLLGTIVLALSLVSDRLPLAAQRALSLIPGLRVQQVARTDAAGTYEFRQLMRQVGWNLVPEYLWVGRGFGALKVSSYQQDWDPSGVNAHIEAGRFYNGVIGMLVNTGLPGTFFMAVFLAGGTGAAWKLIRVLRQHGCRDTFERICCLLAAQWISSLLIFIFLHGDSEFAIRTFALPAGMLMFCLRALERRVAAAKAESDSQALLSAPA